MHESKLDGYRGLAQMRPSRVRLWYSRRKRMDERLSALASPASLGEVVVVTTTGAPVSNCSLPTSTGSRSNFAFPTAPFSVFDILQFGHHDLPRQALGGPPPGP